MRERLLYGAPSFGLALLFVPILVYLPRFYSDVVGIPVSWIGLAFVGGRVLDAVSDPVVGMLSDRGQSPKGRRRPWIAWGCLPLALFSAMIYVPPPGLTPASVMGWAAVAIVGWFLAFTAVNVPYRALGPELTDDYDERTTLFSIREGLLVVGTLFAAVGPGVVGFALGLQDDDPADERTRYMVYVAVAAPVLLATCWACTRGVSERFAVASGPDHISGSWAQVRQALNNRPFAVLLTAFVVIAIGSGIPAVLITYFVTYVLHSDAVPIYLLAYFGVGLACVPVWIRISRTKGKKPTWLAAMTVNAGFFAGVAFVGEGQELAYGLLVAGSGIGGVAVLALPYSMQADVIDHDELITGQRREGLYGGLWSIAEKTAAAMGVGVSMFALELAGYVPNVEQTPFVIDVLRGLYVGVPVVCTAAGFFVALRYPLDREAYAELADKLAARRAQ